MEDAAEQGAAIHRLSLRRLPPPAQRDRGEAHDGAIARRVGTGASRHRLPRAPEVRECREGGAADIEAAPGRGVLALLQPAQEAPHEVVRIEIGLMQQALGQAERHGGVVGPLSRFQPEGAAPDHVGDRREAAARQELDRGADRIPYGEAEETAKGAVEMRVALHAPLWDRGAVAAAAQPSSISPSTSCVRLRAPMVSVTFALTLSSP